MSAMLPDVLYYYQPLESSNLKVALTGLPVAFSFGKLDSSVSVAGDYQDSDPVTVESFVGEYVRTSFDDWYYRIHVIPTTMALGNVAGDTQRTIVVWNAFFDAVALEDFSLTPGQGIVATGTPEAPALINPLQTATYVFDISGTGASTITAEAVWVIDGVEYVVPITGQRSVLFAFRPDWKMSRVNDTYEWLSTVTSTYSGDEQVMSLREEPRRILDYRFWLRDEETRLFDIDMFGWAGRVYGVPWWPDRARLTADAAAGASVVYADTRTFAFAVGAAAVLFRSASDYEMLDVAEVHDDHLLLNNTLSRPWAASSSLYPVVSAIPDETFNTSRRLPHLVEGAARFTALPTQPATSLPVIPAALTYRGEELYLDETNWAVSLGTDFGAQRKDVDGKIGPYSIRRKADAPTVTRTFQWLVKSRADAVSLLGFFNRRKGRRVPVWMPSGMEDFVPLQDIAPAQNSMRVARSEHGRLIGNHPAKRDVVLILRDGQRLPRRILAVEDDGDDSILTFTEAFPVTIQRAQIKRVSYLGLYRLASDSVTFTWATPTVAEVAVRMLLKRERE